eukprot:Rmarinus@m.9774
MEFYVKEAFSKLEYVFEASRDQPAAKTIYPRWKRFCRRVESWESLTTLTKALFAFDVYDVNKVEKLYVIFDFSADSLLNAICVARFVRAFYFRAEPIRAVRVLLEYRSLLLNSLHRRSHHNFDVCALLGCLLFSYGQFSLAEKLLRLTLRITWEPLNDLPAHINRRRMQAACASWGATQSAKLYERELGLDRIIALPVLERWRIMGYLSYLPTYALVLDTLGNGEAALNASRESFIISSRLNNVVSHGTLHAHLRRVLATLFWKQGAFRRAVHLDDSCAAYGQSQFGVDDLDFFLPFPRSLYGSAPQGASDPWAEKVYNDPHSLGGTMFFAACISLASYEIGRGDCTKAQSLLTEVLTRTKQVYGCSHPRQGVVLMYLAQTYAFQLQYSKAESFLREALDSWARAGIRPHMTSVLALSLLGWIVAQLGRYAEAAGVLEAALGQAVVLRMHANPATGLPSPGYTRIVETSGLVAMRRGRYKEALSFLQQCRDLRQRLWGPGSLGYAESLNAIAEVYVEMGHPRHAKHVLHLSRSILKHHEDAPASAHAQLVRAMTFLALVRENRGFDAPQDEENLSFARERFGHRSSPRSVDRWERRTPLVGPCGEDHRASPSAASSDGSPYRSPYHRDSSLTPQTPTSPSAAPGMNPLRPMRSPPTPPVVRRLSLTRLSPGQHSPLRRTASALDLRGLRSRSFSDAISFRPRTRSGSDSLRGTPRDGAAGETQRDGAAGEAQLVHTADAATETTAPQDAAHIDRGANSQDESASIPGSREDDAGSPGSAHEHPTGPAPAPASSADETAFGSNSVGSRGPEGSCEWRGSPSQVERLPSPTTFIDLTAAADGVAAECVAKGSSGVSGPSIRGSRDGSSSHASDTPGHDENTSAMRELMDDSPPPLCCTEHDDDKPSEAKTAVGASHDLRVSEGCRPRHDKDTSFVQPSSSHSQSIRTRSPVHDTEPQSMHPLDTSADAAGPSTPFGCTVDVAGEPVSEDGMPSSPDITTVPSSLPFPQEFGDVNFPVLPPSSTIVRACTAKESGAALPPTHRQPDGPGEEPARRARSASLPSCRPSSAVGQRGLGSPRMLTLDERDCDTWDHDRPDEGTATTPQHCSSLPPPPGPACRLTSPDAEELGNNPFRADSPAFPPWVSPSAALSEADRGSCLSVSPSAPSPHCAAARAPSPSPIPATHLPPSLSSRLPHPRPQKSVSGLSAADSDDSVLDGAKLGSTSGSGYEEDKCATDRRAGAAQEKEGLTQEMPSSPHQEKCKSINAADKAKVRECHYMWLVHRAGAMALNAYTLYCQHYGPRSTDAAAVLCCLAETEMVQSNYQTAFDVFNGAAVVLHAALGQMSHPAVARCLFGMARARWGQGRLDQAEALMCDSLAMRRSTLEAEHNDVVEVEKRLQELREEMSADVGIRTTSSRKCF